MLSVYLDTLQRAVETMHGCSCHHETVDLVHETKDGWTVWRGMVDTFALIGHPQATKAYAWTWIDKFGETRHTAILNLPPVSSPREAVRSAIASGEHDSKLPPSRTPVRRRKTLE
jgi:hypothetical protein